MACYQCGSNSGTSASLCADCREANRLRRAGNVAAIRAGDSGGRMYGAMHRAMNSPLVWFGAVFSLFAGISAYILFALEGTSTSSTEAIFWALILTSMIVNMFCWGLFWVNMLIVEPIWAIVCFFIPIFIYRYVFLYFDQCKWAVITHVLCVITLMISYLGIIASRGG